MSAVICLILLSLSLVLAGRLDQSDYTVPTDFINIPGPAYFNRVVSSVSAEQIYRVHGIQQKAGVLTNLFFTDNNQAVSPCLYVVGRYASTSGKRDSIGISLQNFYAFSRLAYCFNLDQEEIRLQQAGIQASSDPFKRVLFRAFTVQPILLQGTSAYGKQIYSGLAPNGTLDVPSQKSYQWDGDVVPFLYLSGHNITDRFLPSRKYIQAASVLQCDADFHGNGLFNPVYYATAYLGADSFEPAYRYYGPSIPKGYVMLADGTLRVIDASDDSTDIFYNASVLAYGCEIGSQLWPESGQPDDCKDAQNPPNSPFSPCYSPLAFSNIASSCFSNVLADDIQCRDLRRSYVSTSPLKQFYDVPQYAYDPVGADTSDDVDGPTSDTNILVPGLRYLSWSMFHIHAPLWNHVQDFTTRYPQFDQNASNAIAYMIPLPTTNAGQYLATHTYDTLLDARNPWSIAYRSTDINEDTDLFGTGDQGHGISYGPCPYSSTYNSTCNSASSPSLNLCIASIGRCYCGDADWMGIACDIPRSGYDPWSATCEEAEAKQVCGSAGRCLMIPISYYTPSFGVTGAITVASCQCDENFVGNFSFDGDYGLDRNFQFVYQPQDSPGLADGTVIAPIKTFKKITFDDGTSEFVRLGLKHTGLYASLFYPAIAQALCTSTLEKQVLCNTFTPTEWEDTQVWLPGQSTPTPLPVPMQNYQLEHQCLIPLQRPSVPPLTRFWNPIGPAILYQEQYPRKNLTFPWPTFAGTTELACMDYRSDHPLWSKAPQNMVNLLFEEVVFSEWYPNVTARLFGGSRCLPCPLCNRTTSECTDLPDGSGVFCNCTNSDYYGETCSSPICPIAPGGLACGGPTHGVCQRPSNLDDPSTYLSQSYPGRCSCFDGWGSSDCSVALCPLSSSGYPCSNIYPNAPTNSTYLHGSCINGSCVCRADSDGFFLWTDVDCSKPACPFGPNGEECSGYDVCDRTFSPPICRCWDLLATPDISSLVEGYSETDVSLHPEGRWGLACQNTFNQSCFGSGDYCGYSQYPYGNMTSPRAFAGCYVDDCLPGDAISNLCVDFGNSSNARPFARAPRCHCTSSWSTIADPYCGHPVCPNDCDASEFNDTGTCVMSCSQNGHETSFCDPTAMRSGTVQVQAYCACKVYEGNFYFHNDSDPYSDTACTQVANACVSGSLSSSLDSRGDGICSGQGKCIRDHGTGLFGCVCNAGRLGTKCEIAPNCTKPDLSACGTGSDNTTCLQSSHSGSSPVCACKESYLRTTDRSCDIERCLATGGSHPYGNSSCVCPGKAPFQSSQTFLLPKNEPPNFVVSGDQTWLGCRKSCVTSHGIECGVRLTVDSTGRINGTTNRCSDLTPIQQPCFYNNASCSVRCLCNVWGIDYLGNQNLFIDSADGSCEPYCNPAGLSPFLPNVVQNPLTCRCASGFLPPRCTQPEPDNPTSGSWCFDSDGTDLCAPLGQCKRGTDTQTDCTCLNTIAQLDPDPTKISQRQCVSKCVNGVANTTSLQCVCPSWASGTFCEIITPCPYYQYSDPACSISLCTNGGTPHVGSSGCDCPGDPKYLTGGLCETDRCALINGLLASNKSFCFCDSGWTKDSCGFCNVSRCSPGQVVQIDHYSHICSCPVGYSPTGGVCTAPNATYCYYGTRVNTSDGGIQCRCPTGKQGWDCSETACGDRQVLVAGVCQCIPPYFDPDSGCVLFDCGESTTVEAYNYTDVDTNLTLTGYKCVCNKYQKISSTPDSRGLHGCVEDPYFCDPDGTQDWSPTQLSLPCKCLQTPVKYTGERCDEIAEAVETPQAQFSAHFYTIVWTAVGVFLISVVLGGVAIAGALKSVSPPATQSAKENAVENEESDLLRRRRRKHTVDDE